MVKTLACAAAVSLTMMTAALALPVTAADPAAGTGAIVQQVDLRCNRFGHCTLRPAAALHNPHVVRRPAGGPPVHLGASSPPPHLPIATFHYNTHS